jgi:ring-1,2-phenylacetyl-CoA epoxidase subunit PaaD
MTSRSNIKGGDCQSPIADCQFGAGQIGNRKSEIGNQRLLSVWSALASVTDPEIPVISVVDMGIIADVRCAGDEVVVDMTPTFVGCPALDMIRDDIRSAVLAAGAATVSVNVVFDPPWTSDRMTAEGRRKLKEFGLAPPEKCHAGGAVVMPTSARCPHCDSDQTDLESIFGPTLCRSIHYCRSCLQSFEQFKSITAG